MEMTERKKRRKWTDHILILYLTVVLLIIFGQLLGGFMLVPFGMVTDPVLGNVLSYGSFIGIWIVTLLWMFVFRKNRPILKAVGTKASGNCLKLLLLGFVLGFAMNGICVLTAWLHGDIKLYFDSFRPLGLLAVFAAVFVQSSAEELVCRGFLYQRLLRGYGKPAVAIVGNALLFALLHLMNEGVTPLSLLNIAVVGVLFSFLVYYLDSLWCAMAAHAAWNFTQNIVFGLPNSGMVSTFSVWKLDAASAVDSFAYDVGFGIEGTVISVAVLTAVAAGLYFWGRKHGVKPLDVWAQEAAAESK